MADRTNGISTVLVPSSVSFASTADGVRDRKENLPNTATDAALRFSSVPVSRSRALTSSTCDEFFRHDFLRISTVLGTRFLERTILCAQIGYTVVKATFFALSRKKRIVRICGC